MNEDYDNQSFTGKEMCELISKYWKETKGIDKSWEEIWNYSPTGELFMVYEWFQEAREFYNKD
jgi:hypothetical protein